MARAFSEQLERADYQTLTLEERLGMLVDREAQDRDNRRLHRYLKAARLRTRPGSRTFDFRRPRGLDRAAVLSLAESQWVSAHRSLLIVGPTGAGKTFVIRQAHTALYLRAPRMLQDLGLARGDGRLPRLMTAWAKVSVLVIDDLTPATAYSRAGRRSARSH